MEMIFRSPPCKKDLGHWTQCNDDALTVTVIRDVRTIPTSWDGAAGTTGCAGGEYFQWGGACWSERPVTGLTSQPPQFLSVGGGRVGLWPQAVNQPRTNTGSNQILGQAWD